MNNIALLFNLFAILIIAVAFLWSRAETGHRNDDDKMFGRICIMSIVSALVRVASDTVFGGFSTEINKLALVGIYFIDDMIQLAILLQWILLVDFMLHHSRDHLKKETSPILRIMLIIAAVDAIVSVVVLYSGLFVNVNAELAELIRTIFFRHAFGAVELIILIWALWKLVDYNIKVKGPTDYRGVLFIIPIVLGVVISMIIGRKMDLIPLAIGIGLMLLFLAMRYNRRFLDKETGFHSREYLKRLNLNGPDRFFEGALGILIKADDPKGALPGVLKEDLPHEMKIVRLDRNSYFLIGEPHPEMILKLFLQNLTDDAKEKEAVLSVSYDIRRDDESFDELIKRLESS